MTGVWGRCGLDYVSVETESSVGQCEVRGAILEADWRSE